MGLSDAFRAADGVAGAVVVIHSKDSIPFPEDYGTVLTPGVFNAISIRLVKLKKLPLPYTDCINQYVDASLKDVYITLYNTTYSKMVCLGIVLYHTDQVGHLFQEVTSLKYILCLSGKLKT